jgi:hypothetical protein
MYGSPTFVFVSPNCIFKSWTVILQLFNMSKYFVEPFLAESVKLVTKAYQIASFYKLELRDSAAGLG